MISTKRIDPTKTITMKKLLQSGGNKDDCSSYRKGLCNVQEKHEGPMPQTDRKFFKPKLTRSDKQRNKADF